MHKVTIGVFDSGIGGAAVAQAIEEALPHDRVIFASDREHMPYGNKRPEQVLALVEPILSGLVAESCGVNVIACDTVTTNQIETLRKRMAVPLIGIEPMVKPAAEATKTGIIAVFATPATLASLRYRWLKETYAHDVTVLEPDCSSWAHMINEPQVERLVNAVCDQGADVLVLGCTHYHWIEQLVAGVAAKRAAVVQPEQPVIDRLKRVLRRA